MRQPSIRFRLTAWYSLVLAAGLGLFGVSIWALLRQSLLRDTDKTLAECARGTELFIRNELNESNVQLAEELDEYSHALPPDTFLRVTDARGSIVFESQEGFPWPPPGHKDALKRIQLGSRAYRLIIQDPAIRGGPWEISIAAPLANVERLLSRLKVLLFMLSPAVLLIASIGGRWLSGRALKPVDEITAAARTIGIENLSRRLDVPHTGDELQRLSETWNQMLSRLESAVNRISTFTADASHELRTPLAVIRSTAELTLRRPRSAQEYSDALAQIASESAHMTALIEDLLFLARSDADVLELPMAVLDLRPIVLDVASCMQVLAATNGIRLELEDSDCAVTVQGNASAIRRLLLVLLDNAIKYSHREGTVKLRLTSSEQKAVVSIADCGPGIPQLEVRRIFERFYRSPQAREAADRGTGLGLALAASIARYHGATVDVSANPPQGSTFSVSFPLCGAAQHPAMPPFASAFTSNKL
jgi:heavy metal sensor kinase